MTNASDRLSRAAAALSLLIVALAAVSASAGLLAGGGDGPFSMTTPRGETATYAGSGLYRFDPLVVSQEGRIWDAVTLGFAIPLTIAAVVLARRGSLRGRLLLLGLLAYFFYMYFQYAVMVALNPFFFAYVAIVALSPVAFGFALRGLDVSALPARFSPRFPRRLFVGYSASMGCALLALWTARTVAVLRSGKFGAELAGLSTLETQAFDLGLVVPLYLSSAALLLRRRPLGYLLTSVSLAFGAPMSITLPAWIAVPLLSRGQLRPHEAIPFLLLSALGLGLGAVFLFGLDGKPGRGDAGR